MPSYEYEILQNGAPTGQRVTLLRNLDERDLPVEARRVEVPRTVAISGGAVHPCDPVAAMQRGYRQLEARGQLPAHMRVPEIVGEAARRGAGLRETSGAEDPNAPSIA